MTCLLLFFCFRIYNLSKGKIIQSSTGEQKMYLPKCIGSFHNVYVQGLTFVVQYAHKGLCVEGCCGG